MNIGWKDSELNTNNTDDTYSEKREIPDKTQKIVPPKSDLITPGETIRKTWGIEKYIVNEPTYVCKILVINPGSYTSLHFHKEKKEFLYVLSGDYIVTTLDLTNKIHGKRKDIAISAGDLFIAEPFDCHQIKGSRPGQLLEISSRDDIDDIFRIEKSR